MRVPVRKISAGKGVAADIEERGLCRAHCSEMHSGFMAIRSEMPMNCRAQKNLQVSAEAMAESQRVDQLFSAARVRFCSPWGVFVWRFLHRRLYVCADRISIYDIWH